MTGLIKYFQSLVSFVEGPQALKMDLKSLVHSAYGHMNKAEHDVGSKLLAYLSSNPNVQVLGKPTMEVVLW